MKPCLAIQYRGGIHQEKGRTKQQILTMSEPNRAALNLSVTINTINSTTV